MRRLWRMQRGAFEDTAKTAGWQARGFYCRDGVKAPTRRLRRMQRGAFEDTAKTAGQRPAVFIAVTVKPLFSTPSERR